MSDWEESEVGWFAPTRELLRLKRRAQARWLVVLGLAALMAAAVLYKITRPKNKHRARVILRVTESDLLRDQNPVVARGLADYLLEAALPTAAVNRLLERHQIFDDERALGPIVAANEFRSSLDVEVYRNYFAISRGYAEGARTARISIRFTDSDPDRALAVARDVAQLMATTEAENRRTAGARVARVGRFAAKAAEDRLRGLERQEISRDRELAALKDPRSAEAATLRVEIGTLRAAIEKQTARVADTRQRSGTEELREAVVGRALGVDFTIVDERPPPAPRKLAFPLLTMLWMTLFVILVPVAAVGVGAFDRRIHDVQDVERLGWPVVGRVAVASPTRQDRKAADSSVV